MHALDPSVSRQSNGGGESAFAQLSEITERTDREEATGGADLVGQLALLSRLLVETAVLVAVFHADRACTRAVRLSPNPTETATAPGTAATRAGRSQMEWSLSRRARRPCSQRRGLRVLSSSATVLSLLFLLPGIATASKGDEVCVTMSPSEGGIVLAWCGFRGCRDIKSDVLRLGVHHNTMLLLLVPQRSMTLLMVAVIRPS